jgi:signal transduction histidine kinase
MDTVLGIIIKTCDQSLSANPARIIAGYSHIIPTVLSLILGVFVFVKAKYNFFSKIFLSFIAVFSLWLIGDVISWTSSNYTLVYTTWSILDYLEIVFYVLGLYFAIVFIKKTDVSNWVKFFLFFLIVPALYITVTQQSVTGFNQPTCEAFNNDFLGTYKLAVEGIILIIILIYALTPFFKRLALKQARADLVVLGSMFLFLSTFGITEYLASVTGYYEINLYSLFFLPVFLVAIIYSVFELDIFNFHILGTHYLVVGLMVLMSGQLFFITDTTNSLLTLLTMGLLAVLSVILFRNLKRESDQRIQIENLNISLRDLIKQRESLVHLITHKVKGSFTRTKFLFAGILDGTFGSITPEIKKAAEQGLEFDNGGIETVDLVLNVANLEHGLIKYDMKKVDMREIVSKTAEEKRLAVEAKKLKMEISVDRNADGVTGDAFWLKEVVNNLIENSIKYTPAGTITVSLEKKADKVLLSVKDTGLGITEEDKKNLFTEGGRGKDSVKVNVDSTGYGLFTVKMIVEAHKGRVWAESQGAGKGSQFYVELPVS